MMRCGQMLLAEGYVRFFLPAGRCMKYKIMTSFNSLFFSIRFSMASTYS